MVRMPSRSSTRVTSPRASIRKRRVWARSTRSSLHTSVNEKEGAAIYGCTLSSLLWLHPLFTAMAAPSLHCAPVISDGLYAAAAGIDRELVAIAAHQINDQPDDPDEDQQRREGYQQPEPARHHRPAAPNDCAWRGMQLPRSDGDVPAYACVVGEIHIAPQHGHVPGDAAARVDRHAAEEHTHI